MPKPGHLPTARGGWSVYLVRCADGSLYTGVTTDVARRLKQHNAGTASRYTRSRRPVELVYQETHPGQSSALKREAAVKAMPRVEKLTMVRQGKEPTPAVRPAARRPRPDTPRIVRVNRAPVLTLWAAVVAERLGFGRAEALSLGRAVAGLNAQSKGRRLGVFKPHEEKPKAARQRGHGGPLRVEVCGRAVPAVVTGDGVRAVQRGKPVDPDAVAAYLEGKFGDDLAAVRAALRKLARSYPPAELAEAAYPLYERFRPAVPEGRAGWGAEGALDLDRVRRLGPDREDAARPG